MWTQKNEYPKQRGCNRNSGIRLWIAGTEFASGNSEVLRKRRWQKGICRMESKEDFRQCIYIKKAGGLPWSAVLPLFCYQSTISSIKTINPNPWPIGTRFGLYCFGGVSKEIASNFETLLQTYCNFMNGYAKHHDKTELNVLEYLMYQTGNIIRLLITLKQAEPTPDNWVKPMGSGTNWGQNGVKASFVELQNDVKS